MIVKADKIDVSVFTLRYRVDNPSTINNKPNNNANCTDIFFVGRTLFFVRSIFLSDSTSITLFMIEPPVEEHNVPMIV